MLITLDRAQVEAILRSWAEENVPLGAPIVAEGQTVSWSLDTLSQHQAVLKMEPQTTLFPVIPTTFPTPGSGTGSYMPFGTTLTDVTNGTSATIAGDVISTAHSSGDQAVTAKAVPTTPTARPKIKPDVPYEDIGDAEPLPAEMTSALL